MWTNHKHDGSPAVQCLFQNGSNTVSNMFKTLWQFTLGHSRQLLPTCQMRRICYYQRLLQLLVAATHTNRVTHTGCIPCYLDWKFFTINISKDIAKYSNIWYEIVGQFKNVYNIKMHDLTHNIILYSSQDFNIIAQDVIGKS